MTTPDHAHQLGPVLPDPVADYMLFHAKKLVAGSGTNPSRVLWSCKFRFPNMGTDTALELLPTLVLRIRNQKTGEILVQTEPVSFGPIAPDRKTVSERFEQRCGERRGESESPGQLAHIDSTSAAILERVCEKFNCTVAVAEECLPPHMRRRRATVNGVESLEQLSEVPADEFLDWCQSKRFKVGGQQAGDAAQKGGDS